MRLLLVSAAALTLASAAAACIHPPKNWEGSLEQTGQSALVFWHKGVEDLVIKPAFRAKGKSAPPSLAWVVPVPTVPTSYGVTKARAFKDLDTAWTKLDPQKRGMRKGSNSPEDSVAEGGIKLLKSAVAGEYAIQPIKVTGPAGGVALNAWLTKNGFPAVPTANMAYYLQRKWVWLCVKTDTKAAVGELRPLRITFKTPRIVYPLKFSTHQGTFGLTLWVLTQDEVPSARTAAKVFGLSAAQRRFKLPSSVLACAKGVKLSGPVHVLKLQSAAMKGKAIQAWKTDLEFQPAK
jgi:hypothetical protein